VRDQTEIRRSTVFNFTVTELILLLLFALLFISAFVLLSQEADEKQLETLERKVMVLEDIQVQLDSYLESHPERSHDDFFQELVVAQDKVEGYDKIVELVEKSTGTRPTEPQQLEAILEQALELQEHLAEKVEEEGGFDDPPCWIDPVTGRMEYIYDVTISEGGIRMAKGWPKHRNDDLENLPVERVVLDVTRPLSVFEYQTRPLFMYSKTNRCHWYVRLYDEVRHSKTIYKRYRKAVEGHFYILPMN